MNDNDGEDIGLASAQRGLPCWPVAAFFCSSSTDGDAVVHGPVYEKVWVDGRWISPNNNKNVPFRAISGLLLGFYTNKTAVLPTATTCVVRP
jgi:hypothetical protein